MRFHPNSRREEGGAARVRALHFSLNSPVVALDDFPVGPARAGVALSEAPGGALRLEIAVRSLRTGQLRFYGTEEGVAPDPASVEHALSFAEGMGFLFDEDEVAAVGESGACQSTALWHELVADFPGAEPDPSSPAIAALPSPAPQRLALSKFRLVLAALDEESDAEELAVPPPARRAAAESDGNRLLSRF